MDQFFKWPMHDVIKSCTGRRFRVQDRTEDFNVTKYEKLFTMVSDSTLQLTFEKWPAVDFWYSTKEEYVVIWKSY